METAFTKIYRKNFWGSQESVSGGGSEKRSTAPLRSQLPRLVRRLKIRRLVDAPCGDYHWMRWVRWPDGLRYLGIDVVQEMIDKNQRFYGTNRRKFIQADLRTWNLPPADLLICRDLLFHLPYKDILKILQNFARSPIRFFLLTSHRNENQFQNMNITVGDFRRLDLFAWPFFFPRNFVAQIPDFVPPFPPRDMFCFRARQIQLAARRLERCLHREK